MTQQAFNLLYMKYQAYLYINIWLGVAPSFDPSSFWILEFNIIYYEFKFFFPSWISPILHMPAVVFSTLMVKYNGLDQTFSFKFSQQDLLSGLRQFQGQHSTTDQSTEGQQNGDDFGNAYEWGKDWASQYSRELTNGI